MQTHRPLQPKHCCSFADLICSCCLDETNDTMGTQKLNTSLRFTAIASPWKTNTHAICTYTAAMLLMSSSQVHCNCLTPTRKQICQHMHCCSGVDLICCCPAVILALPCPSNELLCSSYALSKTETTHWLQRHHTDLIARGWTWSGDKQCISPNKRCLQGHYT